jgi:hypothetical protein
MPKYIVEKFVKVPVMVVVDADDEFEALRNIAYGDWDMFEFMDDDYEWVIDGIKGNESNSTNYTIIYDEDGNEVRRMTNDVADSYIS